MNEIKEKNIVKCVVLSIITCGIYGIIWFINMTDDMKKASGDQNLSGVKAFLLTLITCGIYGFFGVHKMGKASYNAKKNCGLQAKDDSTLYLILQILGLAIVNYCLIQSNLNDIANAKNIMSNSMQNNTPVQPQTIEQQMPNMVEPIQNIQPVASVMPQQQSMQSMAQPVQNVEPVNKRHHNNHKILIGHKIKEYKKEIFSFFL